jgi:hypothetical protein
MHRDFSELIHRVVVIQAHAEHISLVTGEMAKLIEFAQDQAAVAQELRTAMLQICVNAREIDAEAGELGQIAEDAIWLNEVQTSRGKSDERVNAAPSGASPRRLCRV